MRQFYSQEKKDSVRNLYKSGLSLRQVILKEKVNYITAFKWCKDILRTKSEAHKGKKPKNFEKFQEASKNYKYTAEDRKKMSEAQKRIGTIPPSRKGAIPWNFQDITPIHERIRKSADYKKWRWDIFVRDDFTCQICGTRGGRIRANHIKRFALYPALRLVPTNGIIICERCDIALVFHHEEEWESYFNFNLMIRGLQTKNE